MLEGGGVRVLVVTNMYPSPTNPAFGVFVDDQVNALRRAGADVDVFFVDGKANTLNYLWGFVRFWRQLRRRRYQLIHAHYVLSGLIARAQWRYRVVLTHHGSELLGHPRWQTWLAHLVTPWFDAVIYVSEECRRAMNDRAGWVIPCGVDLDVFRPVPRDEARAQLGLAPDQRLVLWAGDPSRPEKRYAMVEQAMQHVKALVPGAELVLLTGRPHHLVPTYMSACDVLVLTSAAEGSPMVVKEAMACNLPIVSVRVGDVAEVIDGTAGCALAERDAADIAARLVGVLQEPVRTDGRARVEHLGHGPITRRIMAVYRHTLVQHLRTGGQFAAN
jgi:teichuronic acid biosynthesis glycosyltransferase TuaC